MDKPMIGIRQADGSFYEIMDESRPGRKRLVLSAARTDQHGVRIDLYRSEDGTADPAHCLGTIPLDDPEGLGYQDIGFLVELDEDGQLEASAALPGQAPRTLSVDLTPFRGPRSDAQILADASFADAELDTLDEGLGPDAPQDSEPETMTLDLPELEDLPEIDFSDLESPAPPRSDAEILDDDRLAADLDNLDELSLDSLDILDEPETPPPAAPPAEAAPDELDLEADDLADEFSLESLDSLELPPEPDAEGLPEADAFDEPFVPADTDDEPFEPAPRSRAPASEDLEVLDDDELSLETLDDEVEAPAAADSFDLADLDSGFGGSDEAPAPAESAEEWEKISLDDLEPMEFMDTGHEISAPKPAAARMPAPHEEFRMDDDEPLDLGDPAADLGDLPALDDFEPSSARSREEDGLDSDFMDLEEIPDDQNWAADPLSEAAVTKAPQGAREAKTGKEPKAPKAPKAPRTSSMDSDPLAGGLDKTALFLSLSAISLLVLLILVLLFLNMVKAPQAPVIQPEVKLWKPAASLAAPMPPTPAETLDLGAAEPLRFPASTILEVPQGLKSARVSLTLGPGETPDDAARRFGAPDRRQGNQLFW